MKVLPGLLRSLLLSLSLCLLPVTASWAAPVFSLSASPVHHGQPFTLSVIASGLTDLYAYEFDVAFNPMLFQAGLVSEGPFLATAGSTFFSGGTIDNTAGVISFVFDTLIGPGPGASGSGILANVNFLASATNFGTGTISLNNVLALDSNLNLITVQTLPLQVSVPEPESVLLVLAGLLILTWMRGRGRLQF
jgi:general secretion pathway protein D